ncbi:MAG: GNAT family N-acetyltransferase [Syntrophomonadaceae bacterium]
MVTIRPEMPGDEEAIRQVNLLAFGRDAEGKLVDLLRGSRFYVPGLSIVALDGEAIVGHILMSSAMLASSHEAMPLLTLAPMSVIPAYQRRGIGTKLVKSALKRAEGTKYPAVVVLGHPEYYPRFGFVRASEKRIYAPFAVPDEVYMVLELMPNVLDNVTGTVRYPPCFDDI